MSNDTKIKSLTPDGKPDGGFYAVTAAGHLISAKVLKDEMRWATAADVDAAKKHAAALAAKDPKPASGGPLSNGPLAKGG